jgi:hypothetical protein
MLISQGNNVTFLMLCIGIAPFVPRPHEWDVIEAHHDGRFLLSTALLLFTGSAAKEGICNNSRG